MISTHPSDHPGRRTEGPLVSVDVPFELARLQAERGYEVEGHAGRTLTKYADLRVVLEAMKAGVRLPFHETAERMTVQVILGQLRVWMPYGENCDLAEGSFAALEAGSVHELESLQDCAFVLTLAWPPATRRAAGRDQREADGSGV